MYIYLIFRYILTGKQHLFQETGSEIIVFEVWLTLCDGCVNVKIKGDILWPFLQYVI